MHYRSIGTIGIIISSILMRKEFEMTRSSVKFLILFTSLYCEKSRLDNLLLNYYSALENLAEGNLQSPTRTNVAFGFL